MNHSSVNKSNIGLRNVNNRKSSKWKGWLKEVAIWIVTIAFTVVYSAVVPNL